MVRVKICGITNPTDAKMAARLGADAIGFNFSVGMRQISKERARAIIAALPPFVTPVALFVNKNTETVNEICQFTGITTIQLHGDEPPRYVMRLPRYCIIKAFRIASVADLSDLPRYQVDAYLLDAYVRGKRGGTGRTFDWAIAREAQKYGPIILAGGLTPDNVADAIKVARPYAVDVSSGIEGSSPGKKDRALMAAFFSAVRSVG